MSSFKIPNAPPLGVQEFCFPGFDEGCAPPEPQNFVFEPLLQQEPETAAQIEEDLAAQARRILVEAQEQRQHIERQAYEEGFQQGQRDGQEVGRKGLEEVTQRLARLAEDLAGIKDRLYREREEELVALLLLIARKVVGRELQARPEVICTLVEQGFQTLTHREGLKLHLHPQDLEVVSGVSREAWPPGVELAPDGTLTPGGFRLETLLGEVDGTVETRWEQVARKVTQILEEDDAAGAS